jgi:hypothetical protein
MNDTAATAPPAAAALSARLPAVSAAQPERNCSAVSSPVPPPIQSGRTEANGPPASLPSHAAANALASWM